MKRTSQTGGPAKRLKRTQSVILVGEQRPRGPQRSFGGPTLSKETGYVDANCVLALNTTGSIQHVNIVPQGTGVTQRVGKKIQLKSMQFRGIVNADTTTIFSQNAVMLVWDSRPAGALPAITDILDSVSPVSFLNDANSNRFHIVWRWDNINNGNTTGGFAGSNPTTAMGINDYIKFPKKYNKTAYKAAGTGVIADVDEGALYIVGVGGNVSGTADSIGNLNVRLRYWDI